MHSHYVTVVAKPRSLTQFCVVFSNVSIQPWAVTLDDRDFAVEIFPIPWAFLVSVGLYGDKPVRNQIAAHYIG